MKRYRRMIRIEGIRIKPKSLVGYYTDPDSKTIKVFIDNFHQFLEIKFDDQATFEKVIMDLDMIFVKDNEDDDEDDD